MKKRLLLALSALLVASGLFLLVRVIYNFKDVERGGLQVTANIKGGVFLDGKRIGDIPLRKIDQKDTLPVGNYELKIVPDGKEILPFTTRVRINGGVLTAVDKTFLPGSLGSSYVLTLEKSSAKKAQIEITTIPDGALVTIDSIPTGSTPYGSDTITPSEHEIELQKEGFAKKTIRVKTVEDHVLVLSALLGTGSPEEIPEPSPTTEVSPSISPSVKPLIGGKVTILATPNGFLRVRSGAGTNFDEIKRIKTGESFDLLDEKGGWYQIKLDENTTGWIASQFAKKE